MKKKVGILALVVCLLLVFLSPALAQAQGGLTVLNSSAAAEFPTKLTFNLSAQSNVNITDVRLCYSVDRISFAQVVSEGYVDFTPATRVDASWALDMLKIGGLPPGAIVNYWWRVTDAGGDRLETAPAQVRYDDLRYQWHELTEGKVTVYWYKGDDAFAKELMSTAQQALQRLAKDTGASLEKQAELYIYGSQQDLLGAMVYPQEWTGGVAFTGYSIMAIGIAPDELSWGKTTIAHELTHLVVHQMTLNPYNSLPTWLDEGLAMYNENAGMLEPGFATYLMKAVANNSLISVQSLASPFSANTDEAILSYAESYSLVEYLIAAYGQGKMLELLNTFRQGSGYNDALEKVYGFDMDGLNGLWRDYVAKKYQSARELVPALLLKARTGEKFVYHS
jgi:hypothetical protein